MLVARIDNLRIGAWEAEKGPAYTCPNCDALVILKKGRIVVHHFAHKPPTQCTWATGETKEHLKAKSVIRDAFKVRGLHSEVEVEVLSIRGDRRADVLVTNAQGKRLAFEIQHTPISYDQIERRTEAYLESKVPVIWVGILSKKLKTDAESVSNGLKIEKYVIRPWEKWAQAYYYKELWYIDPINGSLWRGTFDDYIIYVESNTFYAEGGEERTVGGYSKRSKKWKTLRLEGPFDLAKINIGFQFRKEWRSPVFSLPKGEMAQFKP